MVFSCLPSQLSVVRADALLDCEVFACRQVRRVGWTSVAVTVHAQAEVHEWNAVQARVRLARFLTRFFQFVFTGQQQGSPDGAGLLRVFMFARLDDISFATHRIT